MNDRDLFLSWVVDSGENSLSISHSKWNTIYNNTYAGQE